MTGKERAETHKKVVNRLRRAQGQLAAALGAVETGGNCTEVVTQLAAVSKAIDRAACLILSTAMRECVSGETQSTDDNTVHPSIAELEKLFLMLT